MFVVLGLKNAWRHRARTALGIVSMAVAAVIFMSSSTLSKGYPAGAFWEARQLLGGEILMLPERTTLSAETLAAGGYTWKFERRTYDKPSLVMGFDHTAYWYGGMRGVSDNRVSQERLDEVVRDLSEDPSVAFVSVRKAIPFLIGASDKQGAFYMYGFLEPRDVKADTEVYKMGDATQVGRYLQRDDAMAGVACGGWQNLALGPVAEIEVPRASADGETLDYENPVRATLDIVGKATFRDSIPGSPVYADPVVFVTQDTFEALRQASGIPDSRAAWGLSISVKDMSGLENYVELLRRRYPDFTVYPVSHLAAAVGASGRVAAGIPMDMRRVTETLSFLIAALLSATNLSILMLARKNEIGILRALGATRWNITSMVLAESIWIAFLGSVIGGILTQPAILWQFLSNRLNMSTVAAAIVTNMGKALGFSVASAVLFGFMPVAKALKVTPAQVLRGE